MKMMRIRILIVALFLVSLSAGAAEDLTITTVAELQDFVTKVNNGTYKDANQYVYLAKDITLPENYTWTPIGTSDHHFMGHFEGWGHKISGLNVSGSSDYQGLFGYVQGGSIRDVAVSGSVSGGNRNHVGGICGYLDSGEISSCYCEASVSGTNNVGGICGTSSGTIKDCYMTSTVDGSTNVGGILGEQTGGNVSECYLSGTVSVSDAAYHGSIMGNHTSGTCSKCVYPSTGSNYYAIGDETTSTDSEDNNIKAADLTLEATWAGILDGDTWKIVNGDTPKLYSFLKGEDVTFTFKGTGPHWITFVPNGNYTVPADMQAYIVSKVTKLTPATAPSSGTVTLHPVTTLNEGRGVILYFYAIASDFDPKVGESENYVTRTATKTKGQLADYSVDKWLKGSHVSPVTIGGVGHEDYILAKRESPGFAFYRAESGSLRRGKAFIRLDGTEASSSSTSSTGGGSGESRLSIVIEGETTPVGEITINGDGTAIFDLYGHQLPSAPSHGLYIQNGKKMWRR